MNRNHKTEIDYNYRTQQQAIKEICDELGLIAYYPDYHADKTDKNTVIIYTKEGHKYNEKLPFTASADEEKGRVCSFENSDINGQFDTSFMNHGKIDLRGLNAKETLRNHIQQALQKFNERK